MHRIRPFVGLKRSVHTRDLESTFRRMIHVEFRSALQRLRCKFALQAFASQFTTGPHVALGLSRRSLAACIEDGAYNIALCAGPVATKPAKFQVGRQSE